MIWKMRKQGYRKGQGKWWKGARMPLVWAIIIIIILLFNILHVFAPDPPEPPPAPPTGTYTNVPGTVEIGDSEYPYVGYYEKTDKKYYVDIEAKVFYEDSGAKRDVTDLDLLKEIAGATRAPATGRDAGRTKPMDPFLGSNTDKARIERELTEIENEIKTLEARIKICKRTRCSNLLELEAQLGAKKAQKWDKKNEYKYWTIWGGGGWSDYAATMRMIEGFHTLSTLLFDESDFREWRKEVDKFFSENVIGKYLDAENWEKNLCVNTKIIQSSLSNAAFVETEYGYTNAAHAEAERSTPITYPDEETGEMITEYFYKITYSVENLKRTGIDLKFNILIRASRVASNGGWNYRGHTVYLYDNNIILRDGQSKSLMGANAYTAFSKYVYDSICIKFYNDRAELRVLFDVIDDVLDDDKQICRTITESDAAYREFELRGRYGQDWFDFGGFITGGGSRDLYDEDREPEPEPEEGEQPEDTQDQPENPI